MIAEDDLLRALRFGPPGGSTAREVTKHLGAPANNTVSSRLSKLALYGKIDRKFVRRQYTGTGPSRWAVYRLKSPA